MVEILAPTLTPTSLEVRYRFKASRERLFEAWTQPAALKQWFRVQPSYSTPIAEVDLQEGGRYRLGMQTPEGELLVATGEYRQIEQPSKLSFTWTWEHAPPDSLPTLVTVEFLELQEGTEVLLRHDTFLSDEQRDSHLEGWQGCFDQLIHIQK